VNDWPLYVFYMVLLALPLLFFLVTKPNYEKKKPSLERSTEGAEGPVGDAVSAPLKPRSSH
jgi:hypothetical protein